MEKLINYHHWYRKPLCFHCKVSKRGGVRVVKAYASQMETRISEDDPHLSPPLRLHHFLLNLPPQTIPLPLHQ
jgi:hypothetical protein